jgi:plastocyanin
MHRTRSLALSAVSLLALGAGLTACGSDADSASADADGTATTTTVASDAMDDAAGGGTITIKDFKFSPNPLRAKVGDTITISNADGTLHTVTAKDKSFDTGRFADGDKTITVSKAGKVEIFCDVHNYMTGVIQVSA